MAKVLIAMGSKSDLDVVKPAAQILTKLGVDVTVRVMSAHRTPKTVMDYATGKEGDFDVFIAAAGKAAHLAGFIAAFTPKPVIGLPVKSSTMDGLDSLLSTVQMPSGVPVATVAVDGAVNAAILAAQMLSLAEPALHEKLDAMRIKMAEDVRKKDAALQHRD